MADQVRPPGTPHPHVCRSVGHPRRAFRQEETNRTGSSITPVNFPQANRVLRAPKGMEKECGDLHVFTDGTNCVSCWQPTQGEIDAIAAGKPVYLIVVSGGTQPPVAVLGASPFPEAEQIETFKLICPTCKSNRWAEIYKSETDPTGFTLYCRRCEEGCVSPLKVSA